MTRDQGLQSKSALSIALLLMALLVGISMIGTAWWISQPHQETESEVRDRHEADLARQKEALRQRREVLSRQLQDLVGTEEKANQVAILRAKSSLDDAFRQFSNKIPLFTEEVTSLEGRIRIAANVVEDQVTGSHETEKLVSEYFEKNVASKQEVSLAITKVLAQFQSDLVANRNHMLSTAALRIQEADIGVLSVSYSAEALDAQLAAKREQAAPSIRNIPAVTAFSLGGGVITEMAFQAMIARMFGYAAGATATGTASGTAGGTLISPGVGTVIGFVVGMAAGIAVDHLMNERMKANITRETVSTLNEMQNEIWSNAKVGLNVRLTGLVTATKESHSAALTSIIREEKS